MCFVEYIQTGGNVCVSVLTGCAVKQKHRLISWDL